MIISENDGWTVLVYPWFFLVSLTISTAFFLFPAFLCQHNFTGVMNIKNWQLRFKIFYIFTYFFLNILIGATVWMAQNMRCDSNLHQVWSLSQVYLFSYSQCAGYTVDILICYISKTTDRLNVSHNCSGPWSALIRLRFTSMHNIKISFKWWCSIINSPVHLLLWQVKLSFVQQHCYLYSTTSTSATMTTTCNSSNSSEVEANPALHSGNNGSRNVIYQIRMLVL